MKPIRFRREAGQDLRKIFDYFDEVAPEALTNVRVDIRRSLNLLRRYPQIGMRVERKPYRRIVTRRYKFKIAYLDEDEVVTVVGIFRYQDREV